MRCCEYENMQDNWGQMMSNFDAQLLLTSPAMTRPGVFNYAVRWGVGEGGLCQSAHTFLRPSTPHAQDMMDVCVGGMSDTEYRTHMSLWAILSSESTHAHAVRRHECARPAIGRDGSLDGTRVQ